MNPIPRARLADFREAGGLMTFRIHTAPDFEATVAEIKRQIPSWARRYDPRLRQWRIKVQYRPVVEELFANVPHPQMAQTPRRFKENPRERYADSNETEQRTRSLWVMVSIAVIVGVALFLWTRAPQMLASLEAVEAETPAPAEVVFAPTPGPLVGRVTGNSNLREGPGVNYPIAGKATPGSEVTAVARARGEDGYWWLQLAGENWIRSDLVVRAEAGELPLDLSSLPDYSSQYGTALAAASTPTQTPVPSATAAPPAAATAIALPAISGLPPTLQGRAVTPALVVRVTDGDTIRVEIDGIEYRVRYIGMDTPEEDEPYFDEASAANSRLVVEKTVYLEKDVSETDQYGRLLRYVWLADGTLVNEALVRQGWAMAASFPPDIREQPALRAAERAARDAERGVWQ